MRALVGWLIFAAVVGLPAAYLYTREPVIDVTAMLLTRGHIEQTIAAFSSGMVEAKQTSLVAPKTIGKVVAIHVREGDRVNEGDVLIELDSEQPRYQVAQAEAHMRQAEIGVTALKQQYENDRGRIVTLKRARDIAEREFNRDKTLYEGSDVGSESMVNLSEINFNQIEDSYIALNNLIKLYPLRIQEAETSATAVAVMLEQSRTLVDWTKVRAPFAGLVSDVYVEIGESVGSGLGGDMPIGLSGAASPGTGGGLSGGLSGGMGMPMTSGLAVARLVDDSDLYVKAPFDEAVFGRVTAGQKVRVSFDAYPDEEFPGHVDFVAATVSRNVDFSRTFLVHVLIEEGKERLIPGMSADVVIVADEKEDVLWVPTEALIREEEGYVVEDGRAVRRKVEIGIGNWQAREVLSGLRQGEQLITSVGLRELRDGVKVNVVDALEGR